MSELGKASPPNIKRERTRELMLLSLLAVSEYNGAIVLCFFKPGEPFHRVKCYSCGMEGGERTIW